MISTVNTFKAQIDIFSVHLQSKKMLNFPYVKSMLNDNAAASEAFGKVAELVLSSHNQTSASLRTGFVQQCVLFILNPFMHVDMTCIAEQPSKTFNLDAGQVAIEILTLQNDLHLKAHQGAPNAQQCMHSSYESCLNFWFNLSL